MLNLQPSNPLRIAVLVKQIPKFEEMRIDSAGRLIRDGVELHMNDYCRRAVRTGCDLALASEGSCTVITLGPPESHTVLREAILCGCKNALQISDPAFAGSDTLATAKALSAALKKTGPWDLVLCGRNSIDADTGQVPAQVAELLDLPLLAGVRELTIQGESINALLEHDDEWIRVNASFPAVLSCAERLCDPCKIKDPEAWTTVDSNLISIFTAKDLGPGPWGQEASPTWVGDTQILDIDRAGHRFESDTDLAIEQMVDVINDRWKSEINPETTKRKVPTATGNYPEIWVITEPNREKNTAELIGTAAHLAESLEGAVVAITPVETDSKKLASQGADKILELCSTDEQTIVRSIDKASGDQPPWGLLAPGTDWGRQVAGRLAVRWNSGLTGDAVGLEIREGRLIAFKPAFGGQLVAEISYSSFTQMATVRPGVLSVPKPRTPTTILVTRVNSETDSRIQVENRWKDDNADLLANATIVIGVGQGVDPNDYPILEKLAKKLGAEICATRKVTDQGWMPRARQVGITGHTIAPNLYIALGTSGKFNHMVGVRSAGTIVGINPDPQCELWEWCDIGFVGDWHKIFEKLVFQLTKTGVII